MLQTSSILSVRTKTYTYRAAIEELIRVRNWASPGDWCVQYGGDQTISPLPEDHALIKH
jgi:hypothetical protein